MSSSSVEPTSSGLRGQPRDEKLFYEEFIRVVRESDVEQPVKEQINAEYSADRVGFARRLLENTPAAMIGSATASRRTPPKTFTGTLSTIAFWSLIACLIFGLIACAYQVLKHGFTTKITVLAAIYASILVALVLARRYGRRSRSSISRLNDVQDNEAQYRDAARTQLTDYLNRLANKLHEESIAREEEARRLAAEESAEVVLSTKDAPLLVEMDGPDPVRVKAITDLQMFILMHQTSAVGISGPRGIGKTTIMRLLCAPHQDHYVGVYVPAPVKYSPADFVKAIHQRMAERILEAHGAARHDSSLLARRSAALTARIVAIAVLGCGSALLFVKPHFLQDMGGSTVTAWGLAAVAVVLSSVATLSYLSADRVQRQRDKNPVALARAELERLAWSAKTQTSSKNSFAFNAFSVEDSSMTELVEREVSHLQQVDAFQKFAALYRAVSNRKIIVAVDELDKIAIPDEAIDVVNGLKDLMHSDGVHFLVSVSEDALARFALRGIPLRDAFDSTFDTITEVDRFSAGEAVTLLEGRVVGIPQLLAYFCHALSGGIPRDLIRLCRKCVDLSGQAETGLPTSTVVTDIAKEHVTGLLNGATIQAKQQGPDSLRSLLEVRDAVNDGSSAEPLFELLDRAAVFLWNQPQPDSPSALAPPLPVVLAVISTAGHYFGGKWTVASWRAQAECGRAQRVANGAAGCIADAGVDTTVALEHLAALREGLQLTPLAMDVLR